MYRDNYVAIYSLCGFKGLEQDLSFPVPDFVGDREKVTVACLEGDQKRPTAHMYTFIPTRQQFSFIPTRQHFTFMSVAFLRHANVVFALGNRVD